MHNERMYDALRVLFPAADPATAWTLRCDGGAGDDVYMAKWNLPSPQPTQSELDAVYPRLAKLDRRAAILRELDAIDMQSVRPLRAKLAGSATAEDEARLASLEAQAQTLRTELAGLPQ